MKSFILFTPHLNPLPWGEERTEVGIALIFSLGERKELKWEPLNLLPKREERVVGYYLYPLLG